MRLLERLQPAERRSLETHGPCHRAAEVGLVALEPQPDVVLDQMLEGVGRVEALVGGREMAGLGLEPARPESLERLELRPFVFDVLGIEHHGGGLAVDQDIGRSLGLGGQHRLFELVFRAGRRRAVGAAVFGRQFEAEALPEDADDEIGLRRQHDLVLEGLVGRVVAALPADRLEHRAAGEFAVQALDDPVDALALDEDIGG